MSYTDLNTVESIYNICRQHLLHNIQIKDILEMWFEARIYEMKSHYGNDNRAMLLRWVESLITELEIMKKLTYESYTLLENRLTDIAIDICNNNLDKWPGTIISFECEYIVYRTIFECMVQMHALGINIDKNEVLSYICPRILMISHYDDHKSELSWMLNKYVFIKQMFGVETEVLN